MDDDICVIIGILEWVIWWIKSKSGTRGHVVLQSCSMRSIRLLLTNLEHQKRSNFSKNNTVSPTKSELLR